LEKIDFRKNVLLLIAISTLVRCCIALFLEFGNDEVYYWTYAQHLAWNYFDHPPMVALLIRFTTINLHFQYEFFVRLGPILCAAFNTWLIFLIGSKIKDEKTGWYASLLYFSSFYCSVIAGTFILPDSPQLLFWVWSIYLMTLIIDENNRNRNGNLLWLGVSIGLCIMSKVHGIFLWFGFGLYVLFFQRNLLKSFYLYVSVVISIVIISPIFFWNLQNHFITYSFHNNRVGFFGKHLDIDSFLQQIFGSVFYNNPVNIILYVIAIIAITRKKIKVPPPYLRLYLLLALPLIIVLLLMSLFNETLPHWSGPAYISVMLLTAFYFSSKNLGSQKTPRGILIALGLFFGIVIVGIPVIKFIPAQLGSKEERILGKADVTLDMNGWEQFAGKFDSLYKSDVSKGLMKENAMIISDYWFPAAHLDYYLAQPLHINLFAVGKLTDIHHYAWLNKERPAFAKGNGCIFYLSFKLLWTAA
jgi:4-amino-4-deoxy-L-arabinose transferase-like glycosyltransferase